MRGFPDVRVVVSWWCSIWTDFPPLNLCSSESIVREDARGTRDVVNSPGLVNFFKALAVTLPPSPWVWHTQKGKFLDILGNICNFSLPTAADTSHDSRNASFLAHDHSWGNLGDTVVVYKYHSLSSRLKYIPTDRPHNQHIHIALRPMTLKYDLLLQQLFHKYMLSLHPCRAFFEFDPGHYGLFTCGQLEVRSQQVQLLQ